MYQKGSILLGKGHQLFSNSDSLNCTPEKEILIDQIDLLSESTLDSNVLLHIRSKSSKSIFLFQLQNLNRVNDHDKNSSKLVCTLYSCRFVFFD